MDLATLEAHRRHATTKSGPISYLDIGEGRTAVFLHGIVTSGLLWRRTLAATASEHRRCIAVDLPGHGDTPPAPAHADVSLAGLAERVIELCDHLNLDRFDLVSNDTGGAIAQIVAARLGDRLSSLTFTNCDTDGNTPPTVFKPVMLAARPALLARIGPSVVANRRLMRGIFSVGYRHPGRLPDSIIDAYCRPVLGTVESCHAFARLLASVTNDDLAAVAPQLARLTVPTQIIWGRTDLLFSLKWAKRLAALIPGTTEIKVIEGGARTHFPDERADEFWPLLQHHWATTRVSN